MTEAVSSPQSSDGWERGQILFLSNNKKDIKIGSKSLRSEAVDLSQFQRQDFVEFKEMEGNLLAIRFPPGMEPAEPIKPPQPDQRSEEKKYQIRLVKRAEKKVLIHTQKGTDEWIEITDDAKKNLIRLKDGQLVSLKFNDQYQITALFPTDENGKYDKELWVKGGGGGGYRQDPAIEKARQESIERQNARGISKDILALCLQQYPLKEDPDNYEKVVALFPQLMEMVKKGEAILIGGM